eukprot:Gregarina_sp_Poly_1__4864@NODE_258_length_10499_cov_54_071223_g225_i0_p3_GENE_NODE_258_length_10499_cov_54_071223_g225_i0NODE_258_length_10499_cov_54_071223_g225_i0_p3_ORF_typecomplete_len394_score63_29Pkinase/PF00069_25/3_5e26Pkinase_Tyr/PF07714_17/1_4e17Pkinase_fungal/PF17667_1/0_014Kdo/PF06293_14/0_055MAP65_ASE1/PF03999_12/0_079_NODE_258_length_10499_cov_54_071223_g225_i052886469
MKRGGEEEDNRQSDKVQRKEIVANHKGWWRGVPTLMCPLPIVPRPKNASISGNLLPSWNPDPRAADIVKRRRETASPTIFPSPANPLSSPTDAVVTEWPDSPPIHTTHNAQIVLYKNHSIVAWDDKNKELRLRELSPQSAHLLNSHRIPHCPMCGQVVNLENFSFEATAYFQILEEAIKAFRSREQRQRSRDWCHHSSSHFYSRSLTASRQRSHSDLTRSPSSPVQPENTFRSSTSSSDIPAGLLVNGYYDQFFVEEKKLGSGSFGQVYLCRHMLDDLFVGFYAVKKIPVGDSKAWLRKMLREVRIRENLHHQNIVAYKHSWLEMHKSGPFCPAIPWLYVLMDYCDGGDLELLISSQIAAGKFLSDIQVWALFLDILEGLNHLHRTGILHRDL